MDKNIPAAPESVALLKALARALQGLHVFLEGLAPRAGRAVGEVEADVKRCMTPATKQVDSSNSNISKGNRYTTNVLHQSTSIISECF